jgi:hypothetical protein
MQASGKQHRRHRSRAEADQKGAEYKASGFSQAEFCQQRDLPPKTLARYLARFRKQSARNGQQATSQRFVAVEVAGARSGGELTVLLSGGLRVEVKRGFGAAACVSKYSDHLPDPGRRATVCLSPDKVVMRLRQGPIGRARFCCGTRELRSAGRHR